MGLLGPNGRAQDHHFLHARGPSVDSGILIGGVMCVNAGSLRSAFGLGYLPQESSIFRRMTVRQNTKQC